MRVPRAGWWILVSAALLWSSVGRGASPSQVREAIDRGRDALYRMQRDGNWEEVPRRLPADHVDESGRALGDFTVRSGQWGGITALATYALLACGESPSEPRLKSAIDFLLRSELVGVYAVGARCSVLSRIPMTPQVRGVIRKDGQFLLKAMKTGGESRDRSRGHYNYSESGPDGRYDHSVSQYGLLGLWELSRTGFEVPSAVWQMAEEGWRANQYSDGSWSYIYSPDEPPGSARQQAARTCSMTAAGVASLFIAREMARPTAGVDCSGNQPDPAIEAGISWLGRNFDDLFRTREMIDFDGKLVPVNHAYYTLYGMERVAEASGLRLIGGVDWFAKGSDWLLANQRADGSWGSPTDTAFALLFLARGRAPVVATKLNYAMPGSPEPPWNQRPRDLASATRWLSRQLERPLNWQVVPIDAGVDALADSRIVLLSGSAGFELDSTAEEMLREFVQRGGVILGNADCNSQAFVQSFRRMGRRLFPGYEFAPLSREHPLFTQQQFQASRWNRRIGTQAMTNGVRLLMLLPDQDLARTWQLRDWGARPEAFEFLANLYSYANGPSGGPVRGERRWPVAREQFRPRQQIDLVRVRYEGNWDPEPAGWRRLAGLLMNENRVRLNLRTVSIDELKGPGVAHLTGTDAIRWSDAQRQRLRDFLNDGGVLLVDAAGGSSAFAASVEAELANLAGLSPLQPAAVDHPVYRSTGTPVKRVSYRLHARRVVGELSEPRVKIARLGNRDAVLFSAEDLSAGLTGTEADGISGYSTDSAVEVMKSMLLHAAKRD
jgi:hypothetical protein